MSNDNWKKKCHFNQFYFLKDQTIVNCWIITITYYVETFLNIFTPWNQV